MREGKVVLLVTCNIHSTEIGAVADGDGVGARARHRRGRGDAAPARRGGPAAGAVAQPRRPDHGDRVVPQEPRHAATRAGACRGSTTTTSATTTTATGSCSRRRRRRPSRRAVYHEWFPQVWLDEHQMGATGPRMFVPPVRGPGRPRHPPARLARREPDRREHGVAPRAGAARRASSTATSFDAYWPGGTKNTAWWKNISGLLTEVASARFATPGAHRAERAAGRRQGARRVRAADRTSRTPGPAASGGCATSWTTSASPPTRCSRPARSAARTSCATRSTRARAAIATDAPREAYRIPARPARPARRRPPRRAARRARRRGRRRPERRRLGSARAALRPLRERDARRRSATRR